MPYKAKDRNKWRAAVMVDGRRIIKDFDTKKEARAWEEGMKKASPTRIRMAYSVFSNEYLTFAQARYTPKVYQEKLAVSKRFLKFLGENLQVDEITPQDIHNYLMKQMEQPADPDLKARTPNAANKDRKNLLAMWNWGIKILGLQVNPVAQSDRFPHTRAKPYTPPETDVLKVLMASEGQDMIFLECYLGTGARRSEIFNLLWEDIDFNQGTITLWTRKTRDGSPKSRTLKMSKRLQGHLKNLWRTRPFKNDPHVFIDIQKGPHYGKPYTARRRLLKGLCKTAGVKPFGFHALRHFVASTLKGRNIDTKTIQELLGHQNIQTTELYLQYIGQGLEAAADVLEDITEKKTDLHQIYTKAKNEEGPNEV